MSERFLIIDTSDRRGRVAVSQGERVIGTRLLEEARRHARDLVPFAQELLREQDWKARDLTGVIVSRGPGSYTGLRVGLMSAKTLAYATRCVLLGIDTFAALARQAPPEVEAAYLIADAQQGKVYVQRYAHGQGGVLEINPFAAWLATVPAGAWITGPGLEFFGSQIPADFQQAPREERSPRPETLLALGTERFRRGEKDDPFTLEPLYLRPSSAEEKVNAAGSHCTSTRMGTV
jgi:tRNA threonylcarbamoyladenosine biosynthesis protein TsaB